MKIIILVVVLAVSIKAIPHGFGINEQLNDEWKLFKTQYGRNYDALTDIARRLVWEDNLNYIRQHNLEYDLGNHSFYLGLNEYADMTHEEFKSMYLAANMSDENVSGSLFMAPENMPNIPNNVDWRKKGFVTRVKHQGACGSCWAFSATGALEGQYFRKKRKLINFSEQQLLDCTRPYGNDGCKGGHVEVSLNYVKKFGIESARDYPYVAVEGVCKYNPKKIVTRCSGFTQIMKGNEADLAKAVASVGPISVKIDASRRSFKNYRGGIYYSKRCSQSKLLHAVLVVGYGIQRGRKYWIVKNSWGSQWGEAGYIRMAKDRGNNCGIASAASYPNI